MKRLLASALALGLIAALGSGCAPARVDFRDTSRSYAPKDYREVLKLWSRITSSYKGVTSLLRLGVTYKSWDFRQAYAALYASRYALAPSEERTLIAQQKTQHREALEFFVSLAPALPSWADIDKERSIWHLALLNDRGVEVHPLTVERKKRNDLEVTMFFPYHSPFAEAFVVRFPRRASDGRPLVAADTRKLIFRLAGAPGKVDMVWQARDDAGVSAPVARRPQTAPGAAATPRP